MSAIRLRIDGRTFRDPQNREVILVRVHMRPEGSVLIAAI